MSVCSMIVAGLCLVLILSILISERGRAFAVKNYLVTGYLIILLGAVGAASLSLVENDVAVRNLFTSFILAFSAAVGGAFVAQGVMQKVQPAAGPKE